MSEAASSHKSEKVTERPASVRKASKSKEEITSSVVTRSKAKSIASGKLDVIGRDQEVDEHVKDLIEGVVPTSRKNTDGKVNTEESSSTSKLNMSLLGDVNLQNMYTGSVGNDNDSIMSHNLFNSKGEHSKRSHRTDKSINGSHGTGSCRSQMSEAEKFRILEEFKSKERLERIAGENRIELMKLQIAKDEALAEILQAKEVAKMKGLKAIKLLETQESVKVKELETQRSVKELETQRSVKELETQRSVKELETQRSVKELEMQHSAKELDTQRAIKEKEIELETLKINSQTRDRNSLNEREPENSGSRDKPLNISSRSDAPKMTEENFNIDVYLTVFERTARAQCWPEKLWVAKLSTQFNRKAQEIFARMDDDICQEYRLVKEKLLEGFNVGPDHYRNKFNNMNRTTDENFKEYAVRIGDIMKKWLTGMECEDFERLVQILMIEKFYATVPRELVSMIKDKHVKTLKEASKLADELDTYRDKMFSRRSATLDNRNVERHQSRDSREQYQHNINERRGQNGFYRSNSFNRGFNNNNQMRNNSFNRARSNSNGWNFNRQYQNNYQNQKYNQNNNSQGYGPGRTTYPNNKQPFHRVNFVKAPDVRTFERGSAARSNSNENVCRICKKYGHAMKQCNLYKPRYCKICKTETHDTEKCYKNRSNINAFVSELNNNLFPYGEEMMINAVIEGQNIKCLRDSGSTITLIKEGLVKSSEPAREYTVCSTAFGTKHTIPLVWINLKTTYGTGRMKVGVVQDLPVDCIIGNDILTLGAKMNTCAATTRSQAALNETNMRELELQDMAEPKRGFKVKLDNIKEEEEPNETTENVRVTEEEENEIFKLEALQGVTKETFMKEQQVDKTLVRVRLAIGKVAESKKENATHYFIDKGLIYRKYYPTKLNYLGAKSSLKQLVVPAKFRRAILSISHDSPLSSHVGVAKVQAGLLSRFYWPGIFRDALQYVRTCKQCQLIGKVVKKTKAPMIITPTIDKPFSKIIMDVVGPLDKSNAGNIYMLVIVCAHTHYPEAIPMKSVDAKRVAAELVKLFARVGICDVVQTDQGSNFMSSLMEQLYKTLGVKHIKSSPYRPETQGVVERLNGTIKRLLKTCLVGKDIRNWDQVLPLVLFSIRSAKHESVGYTPFQLLYGYDIRGPLDIIKELWTQEESQGKDVHQYVLDLRSSMRELAKIAAKNESENKIKTKIRYDKGTKETDLKVGDKVYVLLPYKCHSLSPIWQGPYEILEKVGPVDYIVYLYDRVKKKRVVHINMMRKYEPRISCFVIKEEDFDVAGPASFPSSVERTMTYKDVKIPSELNEEQKGQASRVMLKYEKIFSDLPGATKLVRHQIRTIDDKPVFVKPYPIPQALISEVEKEIKIGLDLGLIEPVVNNINPTAYAAPTVVVKKKEEGKIRCVIDWRLLNAKTIQQRYQIPNANHLIDKVSSAKYLTLCDLCRGYNQVQINPEDVHKTGFLCLGRHYVCKYMSFGLQGSSSTFQMLMDKVLESMEDYAVCYIDDVCIFSSSWEEHLEHLDRVFAALEEHGLTVKPSKVQLGQKQIKFLGHKVGNGARRIDDSKIHTLNDMRVPRTKKEVRSLLGFVNFYKSYIPKFSDLCIPLTSLLKKDSSEIVAWTKDTERAFKDLKSAMSCAPVLISPDFDKLFYLEVDSSMYATGACLSQMVNNVCRPILFISKKFAESETKLSALERECLGLLIIVTKLKYYLLGRRFILLMDAQPLIYLKTKSSTSAKLLRWSLRLAEYEFDISHVAGKRMITSDYLSRYIDYQNENVTGDAVSQF
jgi:RNase H-like domain found in reverse transcriptase/Reverse transcriptase (RNA-dependent DNA polymerase)/Integrase zinc binding domain/Integrase core domain/SCAN domain